MDKQAARADRVPAARSVGEAVSCIPLAQLRESIVRDDRTIDFRMTGGRVYRNVLPYSCSGLGFERAFSYATSLSQLCSTDIIHVLQTVGGRVQPAAACGLGQFQPVELEKKPRG
ncbi:hypothetical protein RXV95_00030 [Novosphingobium sp. ZN18A2]|uniref:hypothetical protein n=1 Tax=Novosphingobium sp. ZN18A2 TaxID=3079861 RepID=UPI0030CEA5DB